MASWEKWAEDYLSNIQDINLDPVQPEIEVSDNDYNGKSVTGIMGKTDIGECIHPNFFKKP